MFVDKHRFSWVIFVICMTECLLWSMPVVTATYDSRELASDEVYKNHIAKDKDMFVYSDTSNNEWQEDEKQKLQSVVESSEDKEMALTNGGENTKNNSKWSMLAWSVGTVLSLAFGYRVPSDHESNSSIPDDSDEEGNKKDPIETMTESSVVVTPDLEMNIVKLEFSEMSDEEILTCVESGKIASYELESKLKDTTRAVQIRRRLLEKSLSNYDIGSIPFENYNYDDVLGKCCENVIGYVPIPIGVVGPVLMNGKEYKIPLATTEGCLVASTHRGCRAISLSGGSRAIITNKGMTRGPLVRMPNAERAVQLKNWIEDPVNNKKIIEAFNSTTNFGKLKSTKIALAGRNVYIRFKAITGDAMGMNMISKGVEKALDLVQSYFSDMEIVAVSGNYCTDKKPSSVNWIEGRGRSIVVDTVIKGEVIEKLLKTTVQSLVDVNINKNLVGSAMAGSIGGFNAHASNILTGIFLATGQDPAQNVESSNCITLMEPINDGKDLYMSVTMPSIEVGTVGGGTSLPAQSTCLAMMNCKGSSIDEPGSNADLLAMLIATAVLAGELSLISAIASGNLVKSHMALNRSKSSPQNIVIPCSKL